MFFLHSSNRIIQLICITALVQWAWTQGTSTSTSTRRVHETKCAQHKKEAYDQVFTYSALMIGFPPMEIVVDVCTSATPFIVGGSAAKPKEFPLMARLGSAEDAQKTSWFCGGTLISNKFVLTAAHCFYGSQGEVDRVRLGELIFNTVTDDARPEDFDVRRYIPHPRYNRSQDYHDIGLVELSRPAILNEYIATACLPIGRGDEFNNFVAVGWGATKFAGSDSDILYKVTLDRFSDTRCRQFSADSRSSKLPFGLDASSQLCAGSTEVKDACNGDSGGPLLQFHGLYPCMYYVVGVTSTGYGCAIAGVPGIYTRVYNYIDWIESIVW